MDFNISQKDFFKYLQICHFEQSLVRKSESRFNPSELEDVKASAKSLKRIILKTYLKLWHSNSSAYGSLKPLWDCDLGGTLRDWTSICNEIYPICTSVSINEHKFNFFFYFTPVASEKCSPTIKNFALNVIYIKAHLPTCSGHVIILNYVGKGFVWWYTITGKKFTLSP